MEKVYYIQDILPSDFDINSRALSFNWLVPNFSEVKEGDPIALFTLYRSGMDNLTFELPAITSGILECKYKVHYEGYSTSSPRTVKSKSSGKILDSDDMLAILESQGISLYDLLKADKEQGETGLTDVSDEGIELYYIYTPQEYMETFPNEYVVDVDDFTDEKVIWWKKIADLWHSYAGYYHLSKYMFIKFRYQEEKPLLSICYDSSDVPIRTGDVLKLLFSEKKVLSLVFNGVSHQPFLNIFDKEYKEIELELTKGDIDTMRTLDLLKARVEFKNGNRPEVIDLCTKSSVQLVSTLFKNYVNAFCRALDECDFKWSTIDTSDISGSASEPCYVYLMKDTINGYHKIGISNNPRYRERTLQSEKPTIELLCAKQYPSRNIAEAIEFALHKAFGDKRMRGEWFNLNAQDVIDLKITLS